MVTVYPHCAGLDVHKDTRQVVEMVAGERSERTCQCFWDALPDDYRNRAIVANGFSPAYEAVVPEARQAVAGKEAALTTHVERFFCTVPQRCARFVRKSPSFSRIIENHVGALWYFICHYNLCRA